MRVRCSQAFRLLSKRLFAKTNGEVICATFIIWVFWFTHQLVNKTKLCVVIVTSHTTSAGHLKWPGMRTAICLAQYFALFSVLLSWLVSLDTMLEYALSTCLLWSCVVWDEGLLTQQSSKLILAEIWCWSCEHHYLFPCYQSHSRWTSNQRVMPIVVGGSMRTQNTQMSKRKPTENKTCPIQWSFRKI